MFPRRFVRMLTPTLLIVVGLLVVAPAHAFEAGAAKVELTPPIGTPLNGYGDRLARGSVARHDPLWARCLYLNDEETAVFLVNTDLCMINPALRDRVLELAPPEVPKENIFLTATHTHSGPGAMEENLFVRFVSGRFMPDVLEQTARSIAQSMREALAAKRRAAIGYDTGKQLVLSANRRVDKGPIDEQIGVIRVDDADGNPIAILANFAAHPTSVPDSDQYSFSADYVGFYYDELETLAGGGCIALFMNGAEGNQTINDPEGRSGWERTESVGKLLAARVKGIANDIDCGEVKLRVGYAEPSLPPTMATRIQPAQVVLQTLEINELLMCFWPGEPIVELGLELRRQALAMGYAKQFSVGLSNNYLMYFVNREYFGQPWYEAKVNFFGPGISDWFYTEFTRLMSKNTTDPTPAPPATVAPVEVPGGFELKLSGNAYARGFQRGAAFAADVAEQYSQRVEAPVKSAELLPTAGAWSLLPDWIDASPLALPTLAIAARTRLEKVSLDTLREIEGMAAATGLPFDGLWILQNTRAMEVAENRGDFFAFPLCTVVTALDDRVAESGMLVGRVFDWPREETPVYIEHRPDTGHVFCEIGFTWNAGIFSGMNDAGLVVCVESTDQSTAGIGPGDAPIEVHLRAVLQESATVEDAVTRLRALDAVHGDVVLVAGPMKKGFGAQLVTANGIREPDSGLFTRKPAGDGTIDRDARARYERVAAALGEEGIVTTQTLESVLTTPSGPDGGAGIWNSDSRHAVIFVPARGEVRFTFRKDDGSPGPFVVRRLKELRDSE